MAEMIDIKMSSVSFISKKDFMEQRGNECFSVDPNVEDKLRQFDDNEIMALEVSINSPARVVDIVKFENIVDFMINRFEREGFTKKQINNSFSFS